MKNFSHLKHHFFYIMRLIFVKIPFRTFLDYNNIRYIYIESSKGWVIGVLETGEFRTIYTVTNHSIYRRDINKNEKWREITTHIHILHRRFSKNMFKYRKTCFNYRIITYIYRFINYHKIITSSSNFCCWFVIEFLYFLYDLCIMCVLLCVFILNKQE